MAVKTNGHGVAGTVTETPKISDGAVGEETVFQPRRRTFGQSLTHALYSAPVLGGLATLALVGSVVGIIYLTRGYNPPPREPPRNEQSNNQNPVAIPPVIDLSTPTPVAIFTPTQTPVIAPVVRDPIVVKCRTCTQDELKTYSGWAGDAYKRVADAFGMVREGTILVGISSDKKTFAFGGEPGPDDPFRYLTQWFETSPEAVDHEFVHQFEAYLLGTDSQLWYSEGLADYIPGRIPKGLDDTYDELLNNNYKWGEGKTLDAHTVGNLYFIGLIRNGLTTETNREALRILRRLRPSPTARQWATPQLINLAYASALSKEPQDLAYLLDLLEPGIVYNGYIR